MTYLWEQVSGTPGTFTSVIDQQIVTFTAPTLPDGTLFEDIGIKLTVDDGQASYSTTASIIVNSPSVVDTSFYVSSADNDRVLLYEDDGTFTINFASGNGLDDAEGLAIGSDGNLYVAGGTSDNVLRFDGQTGAFIDEFIDEDTLSRDPKGLIFDASGILYVAESGISGSSISRYDASGTPLGPFGDAAGANNLSIPYDIEFHGGDLYVSSRGDHKVMRYDSSGNYLGDFVTSLSGGLIQPKGIAFSPIDGDLYVVSSTTNEILRYSGVDGSFIEEFVTTNLSTPNDIDFDVDGNLLVANGGNDRITVFDSSGNFVEDRITAGSGGLDNPTFFISGPVPALPQLAPPTPVISPVFQIVDEGSTGVQLDGSGNIPSISGLPILSYSWQQLSGPTVSNLSDTSQQTITFDVPIVDPSSF